MNKPHKVNVLKLLEQRQTAMTVAELAAALGEKTKPIAHAASTLKRNGELVIANKRARPFAYTLAEGVSLAKYMAEVRARQAYGRGDPIAHDEVEAESEEADAADTFDVGTWASGEVSIVQGETNLLLSEDQARILLRHLIRTTVPSSQESFVAPNKFASFLRPITPAPAPTEPTGLPGVELDGPNGIRLYPFGQPEPMTRAEQFAEAAARG